MISILLELCYGIDVHPNYLTQITTFLHAPGFGKKTSEAVHLVKLYFLVSYHKNLDPNCKTRFPDALSILTLC